MLMSAVVGGDLNNLFALQSLVLLITLMSSKDTSSKAVPPTDAFYAAAHHPEGCNNLTGFGGNW